MIDVRHLIVVYSCLPFSGGAKIEDTGDAVSIWVCRDGYAWFEVAKVDKVEALNAALLATGHAPHVNAWIEPSGELRVTLKLTDTLKHRLLQAITNCANHGDCNGSKLTAALSGLNPAFTGCTYKLTRVNPRAATIKANSACCALKILDAVKHVLSPTAVTRRDLNRNAFTVQPP